MKAAVACTAIVAAAVLAGCSSNKVEAPMERGVCFHAVFLKDETVKFNKLASNIPNLETCAATLEAMRLRFRSLGGADEVTGSYQGQFLFLSSRGVQSAQSLTGARYTALIPTGDGRLAVPGALPSQ